MPNIALDIAAPGGALDDPSAIATSTARVAVSTSATLRRIRHLESFLGVTAVMSPRELHRAGIEADVALVWGRKPSAARAVAYAERHGLPIWYLEDGWIRSASADAHSSLTYSLLVDPDGVYYDGSSPSKIERLLNRPDHQRRCDIDPLCIEQARVLRKRLVAGNITKYNYCHAARLPSDDGRPLVLVIDQTLDDASVRYGGLEGSDFISMLDAAVTENPEARVIVRTHPDVVAGRRDGYLGALARERGVEVSAAGDDPLPWLKRASRIYVGTSQLGYEALLCERPVTVFGSPFYAGWGLTDDRQEVQRRQASPGLDELFHVTHVMLARYCSPMTGERWTLAECISHVELQRHELERNARHFHCIGITPWKRRYVQRFLRSPDGSVQFGGVASAAADTQLCWGFRDRRLPMSKNSQSPWRMEDGFLRSTGLGSDYTAPGSLVVDTRGLYFDPTAPSDLEVLLETADCTPLDIKRAARLRRRILDAGLSKYNVGIPRVDQFNTQKNDEKADRTLVLVVGQVEGDESIRRGCAGVQTNAALLQAVRKARPDAWIVYRPHPDVDSGNRRGRIDDFALQSCADEVNHGTSISDCLSDCDELHTMTSLAGFEALMRGKRVITYGAPFYAGWGLTIDSAVFDRRTRMRTLDELVYLTLIVYPRYVDIVSGEFATAEDMVRLMESRAALGRGAGSGTAGWTERQLAKIANIARGLRYAP